MEEGKRDAPAHDPGTRRGEERPGGHEPGREHTGTSPTGRPTGTSTPRHFTGINPEMEEPIDPAMPHMTTP
jgi:hypothetical protein